MEQKKSTLEDVDKKLTSLLEEIESQTLIGRVKSLAKKGNESVLVIAFIVIFSLAGGIWHFIQAPLQAQITQDLKSVHEVPVLQNKIETIEYTVKEIREEQKDTRRSLSDQNTMLLQILKNTRR